MPYCVSWLPIRPPGCNSVGSRLGSLYLHSRAYQVCLSRWNLRNPCSRLPYGLRAGRNGSGTRRPSRPGVTGGQGVRAASQSSQADGRWLSRACEHRLRGPVRSRHQAARLRGIGAGKIECRQCPKRSSSRSLPGGLTRCRYVRSRNSGARGALADLRERQWVDPCAAGWGSSDPDSRSVRRNDHETKSPTLRVGVSVEP
jgi:hypothetical protein